MAQVVITNQETPKYSENLFPLFTAFNEPYTGWNIMSGVGAVANSDVEKYKGNYSLRVITNEADTVLVFDSANDGFEFIAPKTGTYIFSVKVFIPSDYDTNEVYGVFDTYVNGSGIGDYQFEFSNQESSFEHDKWNNFFQIIQLTEGDEYNLSFKFYADAIGCRAYLDGFKIELDDRNLVLPSRYTFPLNTIIESLVDVTIPEILTGETAFVSATLTGALVGDYIQMIIPTDLASVELSVSYPMVTATNTIRLAFTNNSGSTISEIADASFKFKIVR